MRTFAVVRVHNGAAELLPDLDSEEDTVTIETDRFSTYALVYKDSYGNEKDNEPKTGDTAPVEICATLAMVAGLSYLSLLFKDRKRGMTEEKKKELTAAIVAWGRKGGKLRKIAALAAIFLILLYYHSIGKHTDVDWEQTYGE